MGNSLKKQKEASLAANNTKKSKGERLGWKSISEYKTVSLKKIVGNGNRVNETNIPVNIYTIAIVGTLRIPGLVMILIFLIL